MSFHFIALTDLEFTIVWPPSSKFWDYRPVPLYLAQLHISFDIQKTSQLSKPFHLNLRIQTVRYFLGKYRLENITEKLSFFSSSISLICQGKKSKTPSFLFSHGYLCWLFSLALTLSKLAFYHCDKHHGQKQHERECLFHLTAYNPPWKEIRTGTQSRDVEADTEAKAMGFMTFLAWFAQIAFLKHPGPPAQR